MFSVHVCGGRIRFLNFFGVAGIRYFCILQTIVCFLCCKVNLEDQNFLPPYVKLVFENLIISSFLSLTFKIVCLVRKSVLSLVTAIHLASHTMKQDSCPSIMLNHVPQSD